MLQRDFCQSQNRTGPWRQDEKSITGSQGSQNEPFWILKWLFNACSGLLGVYLGRAQEYSPSAQARSPIAQAKAAATQVQRRRWKMSWEHFHVRFAVLPLTDPSTPTGLLTPILNSFCCSKCKYVQRNLQWCP